LDGSFDPPFSMKAGGSEGFGTVWGALPLMARARGWEEVVLEAGGAGGTETLRVTTIIALNI